LLQVRNLVPRAAAPSRHELEPSRAARGGLRAACRRCGCPGLRDRPSLRAPLPVDERYRSLPQSCAEPAAPHRPASPTPKPPLLSGSGARPDAAADFRCCLPALARPCPCFFVARIGARLGLKHAGGSGRAVNPGARRAVPAFDSLLASWDAALDAGCAGETCRRVSVRGGPLAKGRWRTSSWSVLWSLTPLRTPGRGGQARGAVPGRGARAAGSLGALRGQGAPSQGSALWDRWPVASGAATHSRSMFFYSRSCSSGAAGDVVYLRSGPPARSTGAPGARSSRRLH
jgi:hypothetical protein